MTEALRTPTQVLLTEAEREVLRLAGQIRGLKLSTYIRMVALKQAETDLTNRPGAGS